MRLQAANNIAGAQLSFIERLQVNLHTPTVHGGIRSIHADK
jgi:hypothetical protein